MNAAVVVLVADDDDGHATLICKNLVRAGMRNEIVRFADGQEVSDFLFRRGDGPIRLPGSAYLLLLDVRMPKMDGIDVLQEIKQDPELRKMPVIMITTTDDPREVVRCHELGCSCYITKPVDYGQFVAAICSLGLFMAIIQVPTMNGEG